MTTLDTVKSELLSRRGLSYITQFDAYYNALTAKINAIGSDLVATSTTSATIGTGSKSLTVQTEKNLSAGAFVIAFQTSEPSNFMIGTVTGYDVETGALTFSVAAGDTNGSGTITDWTVALSGRRGPTGAAGGINGGTLSDDIDGDGAFTVTNLRAPSSAGDATPYSSHGENIRTALGLI